MPVAPAYPGVYIEELPSGVRTITGVATSITAFVGRALRGPVNKPVRIQSFADFERQFGGLWQESTLSYAVQQYFLNGGADAVIVRLVNVENPGASAAALQSTASLPAGQSALVLKADDVGIVGNNFRAEIDYDSLTSDSHFNLTIYQINASDGLELQGSRKLFADITLNNIANQLANDPTIRVSVKSLPSDLRRPSITTSAIVFVQPSPPPVSSSGKAVVSLTASSGPPLLLEASSEGLWGDGLQVTVDYETKDPLNNQLFNLTIEEKKGDRIVAAEVFLNLDIRTDSARSIVDVLRLESALVNVKTPAATARPDASLVTDNKRVPTPVSEQGSDGKALIAKQYLGSSANKEGLYALEDADLFNLMCLPPIKRDQDMADEVWIDALAYCQKRRALLIVDAPSSWKEVKDATDGGLNSLVSGLGDRKNAALFFPRVKIADPLKENRLMAFAPCGAVAGVMARTDATRGVWKAPAGSDATLAGVRELSVKLTDGENGQLNPLGVNCLRSFPVYGNVVWGSRTLAGADRLASEWKYIPVRRLALFLEESLYRGTQWVVFEPNDEPLWSQIRLNLGSFMQNLFRQGAFQGTTPREAYFVKCDRETTTQNDINSGIVNIVVGYAPLKPAEFVILKFQQIAGKMDA